MSKSLVIFDLDGTLLNTIDDLANSANEAMRQLGYPTHPLSSYPMMVGNGITRLIERALPEEARDEKTVTDARHRFMAFYDQHCCDLTVPYPGIELMLEELTRRDINLAVTSNKYQRAVSQLINHFFSKYNFKVVLGQHDGVPTKPDPSIVFEALAMCPTPKSDVLYVGDSGVDMETARRACVESVGVTWGFRPVRELKAAYADHIIEEPCDLLGLL